MTTATGPSRSKWDTSTSGAAGASTSASGAASGSATPAVSRPSPGPTPFHGTSQFKHWRYSRSGLAKLRAELNEKSKEVTARNMAEEKAAQQSLGHEFKDPPPPAAYLSVEDELLLVRFYCAQCSRIARALALTDMAEGTAISYLKRFYLKNSVMEWHPKNIMPTCLFLAAKTANEPVPIDRFVHKLQGFKESDVLDLEFAVAQSLGFEFWVRGADKPLRGWSLDLQTTPDSITAVQNSLPTALQNMYASRGTDAEFLFAPSQVALACWRLAARELVDAYLVEQYAEAEATGAPTPYGAPREDLLRIISDVEDIVRAGTGDLDLKKVKEVDKRLKACTNPEKIPGTALYIKRKAEQDDKASEAKAEKVAQARARAEADEFVFGAPIKREQSASASASASAAASATAKPTAPTGLAPSPLSPKKTVKSEDPF